VTRTFTDPAFVMTEMRPEAEAVARLAQDAGDVDALLDAYEILIMIDLNAAQWAATVDWAQRGVDLATLTGRERRREVFTDWLANGLLWGSTHAAEGAATIEALLPSTNRRLTRSWMLQAIATLYGVLGDVERAEAADAEAYAIWSDLGMRKNYFRQAWTRYTLGDLDGGLTLAREHTQELASRGETGQRSTMIGLEAWILVLQGHDEEAERAAAESRALGSLDDAVTQVLWRAAQGVVLARRGEAADADRLTLELIDISDATDSMDAGTAWLARAWVLDIAGRRDEAIAAAERSRELYTMKGWATGIARAEEILGR
jgi:tetratricopeptide (TPR) repeat protein